MFHLIKKGFMLVRSEAEPNYVLDPIELAWLIKQARPLIGEEEYSEEDFVYWGIRFGLRYCPAHLWHLLGDDVLRYKARELMKS